MFLEFSAMMQLFQLSPISHAILGPKIDRLDIQFPLLSPLQEEESLEKYFRMNALLKSLQTILAPIK